MRRHVDLLVYAIITFIAYLVLSTFSSSSYSSGSPLCYMASDTEETMGKRTCAQVGDSSAMVSFPPALLRYFHTGWLHYDSAGLGWSLRSVAVNRGSPRY